MTYVPIPNEDVDVGSPLSTALMTQLRDNAEAQIGRGQTWQDVTGSRSAATAYQNTTDRPIMVLITHVSAIYVQTYALSQDNVTYLTVGTTKVDGGDYTMVSLIVPTGYYYRLTSSITTYNSWVELR